MKKPYKQPNYVFISSPEATNTPGRYHLVKKRRWWEFWKPKYTTTEASCFNALAARKHGMLHLAAECGCRECDGILMTAK